MADHDAAAEGGARDGRAKGPLAAGLAALLTGGSIAWAADLYRAVGLVLYNEQFLAGMLGIALALVYIAVPARKDGTTSGLPWYDAAAAVAGFAACAYVAYYYEPIFETLHERPLDAMICSVVIIALVAEGLRRTTGNVLFGVMLLFVAFGLLGHFVPGPLRGREVAVDRLVVYLGIDSNGLLGLAMTVSATIVITFVFFGNLLARSGGSEFFTDISLALMGRYRGGSAKIAVTASALFGSISGSAVSNVVSTGVITIPLMRQAGYPAHSAAAIEAVASTGGQLMPPMMGAAAFLMAEFLQIPYRDVVLAALIPAILYYAALFIQTDLEAARDGIARVDESRIPKAFGVFRQGWLFLVPFVVIIVGLFTFNLRPEAAALYASIVLLAIGVAVGYAGKRMKAAELWDVLCHTGTAVLDIVMIGAAAGIIMGVLNISTLGFALTQTLAQFGHGNIVLLLLIAAGVCIVLGMGMPTVGVYILLAALIAPSLVEVGIPEIGAHMYVLYFGMMSMITPPVAIAAFAAASVAGSDPMRTGFAAVKFGWSAYVVPFLFVAAPELLMRGDPWHIALAFVTALAGVWLVSIGVVGYFTRRLSALQRMLFAVSGLALLVPASAFDLAGWTDIGGLALAVALVWFEIAAGRRARAASTIG